MLYIFHPDVRNTTTQRRILPGKIIRVKAAFFKSELSPDWFWKAEIQSPQFSQGAKLSAKGRESIRENERPVFQTRTETMLKDAMQATTNSITISTKVNHIFMARNQNCTLRNLMRTVGIFP
jgi:hypothetical protein